MGFTHGLHSLTSYLLIFNVKRSLLIFNVFFAIAFTSLTSCYEDYW